MNKDFNNKFKECICFLVCIFFIFFVYVNLNSSNNLVINPNFNLNKYSKNLKLNNKSRYNDLTYKSYRTIKIPQNVINGAYTSGIWEDLFFANKKVIFYVFEGNDPFSNAIISYYRKKKLSNYYILKIYSKDSFNNMRYGTVGPTKICNSFAECMAIGQKASNYNELTLFLKNCGKTMCVINPRKQQYTILKNRTSTNGIKFLYELKNW